MSFFGAVRVLVVGWSGGKGSVAMEALPELPPGAFAHWVRAAQNDDLRDGRLGAACVTPDGRVGRVVEVVDTRGVALICEAA